MWYIGQPIITIKDSKCGKIKKGQEFVIQGILNGSCKCRGVSLDVGLITDSSTYCGDCDTVIAPDPIHWKSEKLFAPFDIDISEITKILEEPIYETA